MTLDKLYTKVYDDLFPIARDVKAVRDEAGVPVDPANDPYILMRNSRGSGLAAESQIMNGPRAFGTNDATGTRGLKPILDDAQKAGKGNLDEFRAFLIGRRDLEKLQQGVKTGGDATTAQAVVTQLGTKYASLAKELTDFQNDMARRLVDSGVISEDAFNSMKALNADYVPFYRIVGEDVIGGSKGKGLQDPIRKMTGSDAEIVDPIQSIIRNAFSFEDIAKRNNARRAYIAMADQVPGLAEKVTKQTALDITPEVQKALKAAGVEPELADTFMAFRRETPNAKHNEINVFENGKRSVYRVEQDVAEAFNGLTQPQQGVVTKLAGSFARALHAGVTATPDFILKNLIRDPVDAWIKGGAQPASPLTNGLKEVVKQDEAYQRWAASGGGMASLTALDRAYINRNIYKLDADTGLLTRAWNVVTSPIELMKEIGDKGDQLTRLAAFRKAKAQGLSDTEAAFKARESTVDFARRG
ncbi:MAG: hypothetical protein K2Q20_08685, partial [Phycisphaerales bacterium]|nr:hypothetical protein [Phycisphaerales bacterium]